MKRLIESSGSVCALAWTMMPYPWFTVIRTYFCRSACVYDRPSLFVSWDSSPYLHSREVCGQSPHHQLPHWLSSFLWHFNLKSSSRFLDHLWSLRSLLRFSWFAFCAIKVSHYRLALSHSSVQMSYGGDLGAILSLIVLSFLLRQAARVASSMPKHLALILWFNARFDYFHAILDLLNKWSITVHFFRYFCQDQQPMF